MYGVYLYQFPLISLLISPYLSIDGRMAGDGNIEMSELYGESNIYCI